MAFTKDLEVNSPYELLFVGISNYLSRRLGLEEDVRDFQYLDEKKIENFKYQEVVCELAHLGYLNYKFSENFKLRRSDRIKVLDIEFENILLNYFDMEKRDFFITVDDLRESEDFTMFRTVAGYDFSLVVLAIVNSLLNYRYDKNFSINLVGDDIDVYLREASTLHYYVVLGYIKVNYQLSEVVLNSVNANIFKEIGVIAGYFANELISYYDKLDMMKKLKLVKGSVVYLYKKKLDQLTIMGDLVEDCSLAIVEDFGDFGIKLRKLPIKTSYEYIIYTYNQFSDDVKELYGGLENFFPYDSKEEVVNLTWQACGVSYVQNSKTSQMEDYFITKLDMVYPVKLPILKDDGSLEDTELNASSTVWFLLKQYKVDFNETLYLKEYKNTNVDYVNDLVEQSIVNIEELLQHKLGGEK